MGCSTSASASQFDQTETKLWTQTQQDLKNADQDGHPEPYQENHFPKEREIEVLHRKKSNDSDYHLHLNNSSTGFEDSQNIDTESPSRKRNRRNQNSKLTVNTSYAALSSDDESIEESEPFDNPTIALNEALGLISQDQWEKICCGLNIIRRLAYHHPDDLCPALLKVNEKVVHQVKNLRSKVCVSAITCLRDLYRYLQKNMEVDLDQTVSVLLLKSGEAKQFIREAAESSLSSMVENVTTIKAVTSLTSFGACHRNVTVRSVTAHILERLVEVVGPEKVFGGNQDLAEKILLVAAQFLNDGSPDVRLSAQKIFFSLMFHNDFDRVMKKHDIRQIQDKLDILRKKVQSEAGLGSSQKKLIVADSKSSHNRKGSENRLTLPGHNVSGSFRRKSTVNLEEELRCIEAELSATDWNQRMRAVEQLQQLMDHDPDTIRHSLALMNFIPCLHDPNTKVSLQALRTLKSIIPAVASSDLSNTILNMTVETIVSNFALKNRDIHEASTSGLDALMDHCDPLILLPIFINAAQKSRTDIAAELTERVAYLVSLVYPKDADQTMGLVLPLLWFLLKTILKNPGSDRVHSATELLVMTLHSFAGETLFTTAKDIQKLTPEMQELLEGLVQNS